MSRAGLIVAAVLMAMMCGCEASARVWLQSAREVKPAGQLLKNPGLENSGAGKLVGWSPWQAGYEIDTTVAHSGQQSARCASDPQGRQHGLGQTVVLNQTRPVPILARAWSRAKGVTGAPDSNYSLYLDIEYTDGTPLWGQTSPFQTGTHDWQRAAVVVVPAKPIRSVTVYGIFRGHKGTVWFDDFELYQISGAGMFDFQPGIGEPPAAEGMEKLRAGDLALFIDPRSGAMSLDGKRLGGIVLRDFAADSAFVLPELAVKRQGNSVQLKGAVDELGLAVQATLRLGDDAVWLDGTVRDTTGRDRAVVAYWALPVPQTRWIFCRDPRRDEPVEGSGTYGNFMRVRAGAAGLASRYPFAPIASDRMGLAVGAPIRAPRLCRFAYDAGRRVMYAAFDLGLSQAAKKSPGAASFHAVLFRFDPAWRFRAALKRYYELNGDAFACRVAKQGIWMPFADISTVQGWQDFGFQFQEGAPNPAFDEAHGIYSFPYIEPMSYWMAMPPDMPRTDEAAMKLLRLQAKKGKRRAIAALSSGLFGPDGRLLMSFHDTPWCNGALLLLNPDPDLPAPPDAPVTQYMVYKPAIDRVLQDRPRGGVAEWTAYGIGYTVADGEGRGGSSAARCSRRPGQDAAGLRQFVAVNQKKPRPLVAKAWSRADKVTGERDADYSLYIDVTYRDGTHKYGQVAPFDTGTHAWQMAQVRIQPEKPIASLSLNLLLRGNHYGTVWFDDVSVVEEGTRRELVRCGDFEKAAQKVLIDGLYLDSLNMGAMTLNYRREHFASADLPLVFDRSGRVCEMGHFMTMEFVEHVAKLLRARGKLLFANGAYSRLPWPAGWMDVGGTETNWNPRGHYSPASDTSMLFWRAMSYKRPFLTLQNTDFDRFPPALVQKYFQRCCYYGILPSMFSPEASGRTSYWVRPDLYNRDRPLFKKYIPVIRRLAEAGWEPVTYARSDRDDVWVERFGGGREVYFTVFNSNTRVRRAAVVRVQVEKVLDGPVARAELLLPTQRAVKVAGGAITLTLEPEQVAVVYLAAR